MYKNIFIIKSKIYFFSNFITDLNSYNYIKSRVLGKYGFLNIFIKKICFLKKKFLKELKFLNELKIESLNYFKEQLLKLNHNKSINNSYLKDLDISLPGRFIKIGKKNIISEFFERVSFFFLVLGFDFVFGPEIENELYCFDYLNFPKNHPARDMQDTFYLDNFNMLRTHTTSVQARLLEKKKFPLKCVTYGKVYRNEKENNNHQSMFFQYEMFWVDKKICFNDLLSMIKVFLIFIFNDYIEVRIVPKYYPYTFFSLGIQIKCSLCLDGCSFCNFSKWVTIAGAGQIHENILKNFSYDINKVSGLAFGFGVDRLIAKMYKISDIKYLYS